MVLDGGGRICISVMVTVKPVCLFVSGCCLSQRGTLGTSSFLSSNATLEASRSSLLFDIIDPLMLEYSCRTPRHSHSLPLAGM